MDTSFFNTALNLAVDPYILGLLILQLLTLLVVLFIILRSRKVLPIKIKYIDPTAKKISLPRKGDLGIDLYANEDVDLLRGEYKLVSTGLSIEMPEGYGLIIQDRSSVSKKAHSMAGVIDTIYRGEIKVALYGHTLDVFRIQKGDKIAQARIVEDLNSLFEFTEVDELSETERGDKGFGSTGSK